MELFKGKKKFILLITFFLFMINTYGNAFGGHLFMWLCLIVITDLILVYLKERTDERAERILVRHNSLRVDPGYGGET